jgi:integrase
VAQGKRGTSEPFLKAGSQNFYIRYTVPGEPERVESTGTSDVKEARRKLNAKRKEIDDGQVGARGVTVGNLLDLYLGDKKKKKKFSASVDGYVRLHLRPAFGPLLAEKLTTNHIDAFIEQKRAAGKSDSSINRWLEALKRAYTIGRKEKQPPIIRLEPKIEMLDESYNVREGFLSREQYEALLVELPGHLQTLLVLGYHLGMRRSELVNLKWEQVDWHANSIRLEKRQTKTKQSRVAPLYGDLRAWLESAYTSRDTECATIVAYVQKPKAAPGKTTPVTETKTSWNSAAVRAKVPGALVHDLRRAAVRNMIGAGLTERLAMMISGHRTRSMFDRYQIVDEKDIELAGQKMAAYEIAQKKLRTEALEREKLRTELRTATAELQATNAYKV